jgi:hypothetical protein
LGSFDIACSIDTNTHGSCNEVPVAMPREQERKKWKPHSSVYLYQSAFSMYFSFLSRTRLDQLLLRVYSRLTYSDIGRESYRYRVWRRPCR